MSADVDCDFQISAGACVGMVFPDRPSCTRFVQDLALARGRRAIIDKGSSGGKSVRYKCDSATTCPFEIRLNKCKGSDVQGYRISAAQLERRGCSGVPRPTAKQVAETAVARAAVTASPNITALALQEQIKSVAKLSVGKRMVYRVQGKVKEANMGDYEISFRQIRPLLEAFCAANPTSHFDFECDAQDQYSRAFLSNPYVARHCAHGQDVYGIDGTFMKHGIYRETMLILVGRNGNNKNIILAVALSKSEDEDNCAWFLRNTKKAGIQLEGVPVFSDRGRGLCAALERCNLGLLLRFCTRHIVGNIRPNGAQHQCKLELFPGLYPVVGTSFP